MSNKLLMGNTAMGIAAIKAGVKCVCGYPGTPSTEVLETVAKYNKGDIHVEWSVNEKVALETATGASFSGVRTLVTMKQVGLNVASDPLMTLSYLGIKGAMVILVADDPGPISSQTEQDTRTFGEYSKVPVFDPSTPKEAFEMMLEAFEYSEKYNTPVFLRPTTRVCHACQSFDPDAYPDAQTNSDEWEFVKDDSKYVVFPRTSYLNHIKITKRENDMSAEFSEYAKNTVCGDGKLAVVAGGVSYEYLMEALEICKVREKVKVLKVSTPYPFPEKLAESFIKDAQMVVVFEELDPYIEKHLMQICGKFGVAAKIHGKLDGTIPPAGELSVEIICDVLSKFIPIERETITLPEAPVLPVRPPVLCAGCPHRASFYAVKQAVKQTGTKAVMNGDIGCYTLGNAAPLGMVDTCLCMGAGITMAQGMKVADSSVTSFAFVGDSTFFASGMTGVVNSVYNKNDMIVVVLDNSTTAMTGNQPHPGTGVTMMGDISPVISIEKILRAIGITFVETVNPFEHDKAVETVKRAIAEQGTRVIIFKAPCIAVAKPTEKCRIDSEKCVGCKKCIKEIGCPAISFINKKAVIESSLCTGCGLCKGICPTAAISDACGKVGE